MKSYTKVPNEVLEKSELSVRARFLYCVLLKHCGNKNSCYPGQKRLSEIMGYNDPRYIRTILRELVDSELIQVRRTGFNRTNTYVVSKNLCRNNSSCPHVFKKRNLCSPHLGSKVPFANRTSIPTKSTQIIEKVKNHPISLDALEKCRAKLVKDGILQPKKTITKNELSSVGGEYLL